MRLRSLQARFVAGALFWTGGLLAAAFAIAITIVTQYPKWTLVVHNGLLAFAAAILVTAGLSVIRRGLSPLDLLRERLVNIREGRSSRLEGEYPSEVAPLVDDLNTLLEEREHRVVRAVAKAGDLAHGLKTPLAVLAQEVGRAESAGQHELAASIQQQVTRMRRQIESHLAQARATAGAASAGARTEVAAAVAGLLRTMERLYADRRLTIQSTVSPDLLVRVPLEDLEEMIGNLLDNACKWARSTVQVSATRDGLRVRVAVNDDGQGLEPGMRDRVLQRGVRADQAAPGSGLGLSIVRDLAEAYGGAIALERSPEGGVSAQLTVPLGTP